ncbi:DNA-deoxyinosine glycosylase [Paraburkholderia sp.]|uniref:DNA-deoxyinosine glycosylase n=1 Tax=Paraburkholderia sp. TaxID=1926495 RepID=UPI0023A70AF0|nr:DNA-deoxyinosine glycosylase [Paraburkholderia sp.]MDE1182832.1 DNA-deoxyinosine glycosylase [Paraburkholderia sp.]
MLRGFPPVMSKDTHTLILGSFPGEASLAATQYYAHPRNQFWRLLGTVLDEPLVELAYEDRLLRLLHHRIGVWDVLAACEREGSLDAAIRHATPNDFAAFRQHAPDLSKVCFNGKTAGRFAPVIGEAGYTTLVLPSSSPANAMLSFDQKLRLWRDILT